MDMIAFPYPNPQLIYVFFFKEETCMIPQKKLTHWSHYKIAKIYRCQLQNDFDIRNIYISVLGTFDYFHNVSLYFSNGLGNNLTRNRQHAITNAIDDLGPILETIW